MKHIFVILTALGLLLSTWTIARADVRQPVCLNVCLPEDETIPAPSAKVLENKLLQIATSNTMASMGQSSRFFLSAHVAVLSKEIVPSNPPKISQRLSVTLYIGDVIDDVVYATESVELTGIGTTEAKAFNTAFQKLQVKNLESFLNNAFDRIDAYYEKNYERNYHEAEFLASQNDFEGAFMVLSEMMGVCDSHMDECAHLWEKVYSAQINYEGEQNLYRAKNIWSTSKNETGAEEAVDILCEISPDCDCINSANSLVNEIGSYISSSRQAKSDELQKRYNDELELKRAEIKTKTVQEQVVSYQEKSNRIIDLNKVTRVVSSWFKA